MTSNRPKIFLFVDDSPTSKEALKAFREADVELITVQASGPSIPSAKLGNTVYTGRWGIDFLLQGLPKRVGDEVVT